MGMMIAVRKRRQSKLTSIQLSSVTSESVLVKQAKHLLGMFLQLFTLGVLPLIIVFQLFYGFRLIVMPVSLLIGIALFSIGTALRESNQ